MSDETKTEAAADPARLRNRVKTQERYPGQWYAWIDGAGHGITAIGATESEAVCALAGKLGELIDRGIVAEAPGPFTRPTEPANPKPVVWDSPAYSAIAGLFGEALAALQQGRRVARTGWNGKGMWLALIPGDAWAIKNGALPTLAFGKIATDTDSFLPWIGMRTADGRFVPWLASQTDLLAADWVVLD